MSQRFLNLIRNGATAEVAAAVEEDPSLITCRDAQGVSAFLWSIYSRQPLVRDFLLTRLSSLDIFECSALGDCARLEELLQKDAMLVHESLRPMGGLPCTWRLVLGALKPRRCC